MSMFTMIVILGVCGMLLEAWRHHTKSRSSSSADKEKLDRLHQRLDQMDSELRDRVETLERIVTDNKDDLKRQFDHLDKAS
jgi:phage shock protein B